MPPKLKRVGVQPPNDGAEAVNIDRRLKLTAIDDSCSHSNAVTSCDGDIAASARSCVVEDVSFVETNGATEQLSKYLASLSELERRVCSIARDHLQSSFDLSRSSGYIAWKSNK